MSKIPDWKEHFPVRQSAEHNVSRREFARVLGLGCLGLGALWGVGRKALEAPPLYPVEPLAVARIRELIPGAYKLFTYPTPAHPCILVHLRTGRFVAYSQNCTHLQCPVHYDNSRNQMTCPCHNGVFNAENGAVVAGPPPSPLPSFPVTVKEGLVWVNAPAPAA